jgi:hypothetical protein
MRATLLLVMGVLLLATLQASEPVEGPAQLRRDGTLELCGIAVLRFAFEETSDSNLMFPMHTISLTKLIPNSLFLVPRHPKAVKHESFYAWYPIAECEIDKHHSILVYYDLPLRENELTLTKERVLIKHTATIDASPVVRFELNGKWPTGCKLAGPVYLETLTRRLVAKPYGLQ